MPLENSILDRKSYPEALISFVIDGRLDPCVLKTALERVIRHFPVQSARIRKGSELQIPENPKELVSWSVENHTKLLREEFTYLPTSRGKEITMDRLNPITIISDHNRALMACGRQSAPK